MQSLPKSLRLLRRRDFSRVQRSGARGSSGHLQVVMRPGRAQGRFGLTVSKKVGNAVARNLVKRRLREILRRDKALFSGVDLVVIARPGAAALDYQTLLNELTDAVTRARATMQKGAPRHRRAPNQRRSPA